MNSYPNIETGAGIGQQPVSSRLQEDTISLESNVSTRVRDHLAELSPVASAYQRVVRAIANFVNTNTVLGEIQIRFRLCLNKQLGKNFQNLCACVSFYLREPIRFTRRILLKSISFHYRLEYRRNRALGELTLKSHVAQFDFEQKQSYLQLISQDKRSRILVSYHFGDFVYGMNYLASFETANRKRLVLSQSGASREYFDNMQRAFGQSAAGRDSQIILSKLDISSLSSQLRKGNCTLVLFCDLPGGYGERVRVKFLNRYAWFPKGPAILSLVNKIPLLPAINYFDGKRYKIVLANQLEPLTLVHESFEQAVGRVTQDLVNFFERFFNRYPEQWRYLQKLPLYFVEGNSMP